MKIYTLMGNITTKSRLCDNNSNILEHYIYKDKYTEIESKIDSLTTSDNIPNSKKAKFKSILYTMLFFNQSLDNLQLVC